MKINYKSRCFLDTAHLMDIHKMIKIMELFPMTVENKHKLLQQKSALGNQTCYVVIDS